MLGADAKLYTGTEGAALDAMTLFDTIADLDLDMSNEESDKTTRATGGRKRTDYGLQDMTVTFKVLYTAGDTKQEALRDAFVQKNRIGAAVLTAAQGETDAEGPYGDWIISQFKRGEPIGDQVAYDVTLRLYTLRGYQDAAGT